MLSFKFSYLSRPSREYKLRYGLEKKSRPYLFNYPVGLSNGKYRFDYDRRSQIHIEDDEVTLVKWGSDIEINKEQSFVRWARDMDINKEYWFIKEIRNVIIGKRIILELIERLIVKSKEEKLENKSKVLNKFNEKDLTKIKNEIKIEDDFVFDKTIGELIIESMDHILERLIQVIFLDRDRILSLEDKKLIINKDDLALKPDENKLYIENLLKMLTIGVNEVLHPSDTNVLSTIKKFLKIDLERPLFKTNFSKLEFETHGAKFEKTKSEFNKEVNLEGLYYKFVREFIKSKEVKLSLLLLNELIIDDEIILMKQVKEILLYEGINLFKEMIDFNMEDETSPFLKKVNEIYKHYIKPSDILFLYTFYDIGIEDVYYKLNSNKEIMDTIKERLMEKDFEVDLTISDTEKILLNNTKHDLLRELKEMIVEDVSLREIYIDGELKNLDKVNEIIIHVEEGLRLLDKEYLVDLFVDNDIYKLIKRLKVHDIISEDESLHLEKSFVGKILLRKALGFDRVAEVMEIIAGSESLPMVKSFREIVINNTDINAIKQSIEINLNKEKEFKKVVGEIEIEGNEEKIKFNKRFWFLRATDPFDLKILPYSDYPYSDRSIVFGNSLIPDNWQLDMPWVPRLHEEISEHPMPFGSNLGREEMALSIEIMIDVINIMILIWSRMFYNFSGYTGSQAVIRFTKILYDWLMLETSLEEMDKKDSTEHYFRCYNWIRWEAEKVAIKAKDDMSLSGNMYIDEWIFELIYYMENHHFDTMPIFDVVGKMDEYRALLPSDDPQGDINFVLDKVKGMRHKILEGRVKKNNE